MLVGFIFLTRICMLADRVAIAGIMGARIHFTDDCVMGGCVTGPLVMGARVVTRAPVTRGPLTQPPVT